MKKLINLLGLLLLSLTISLSTTACGDKDDKKDDTEVKKKECDADCKKDCCDKDNKCCGGTSTECCKSGGSHSHGNGETHDHKGEGAHDHGGEEKKVEEAQSVESTGGGDSPAN